jgi:hypothetical protein
MVHLTRRVVQLVAAMAPVAFNVNPSGSIVDRGRTVVQVVNFKGCAHPRPSLPWYTADVSRATCEGDSNPDCMQKMHFQPTIQNVIGVPICSLHWHSGEMSESCDGSVRQPPAQA